MGNPARHHRAGLAASADRRARWIGLADGVALPFALGAATPLQGTLFSLLSGLGKARIPVRAIHIFDLTASMPGSNRRTSGP